jgi:hypothetical protein
VLEQLGVPSDVPRRHEVLTPSAGLERLDAPATRQLVRHERVLERSGQEPVMSGGACGESLGHARPESLAVQAIVAPSQFTEYLFESLRACIERLHAFTAGAVAMVRQIDCQQRAIRRQ